jgi:hypothetical protein
MIPLKDNWKFPLSFRELFRNWNRAARWLNGMQCEGGQVIHNENGIRIVPPAGGSGSTDFAWNVTGTGLAISITPGDIELGPDTVIVWDTADFTGCLGTITATTGDSYLYIWVNVDVENETAEMLSGTSITALSGTEKKTIMQKKIAKVSFTADVVTFIARHQCGNIFIPRL